MHKPKQILLLFIFFMLAGITVVFLTHPEETSTSNNFVSADSYVEHIRPWLNDFKPYRSNNNLLETKNNFLNFKSSDKDIGPVHISLFLAFDSWEKFYSSNLDDVYRQNAIDHFSNASRLLPELKPDIDNLISMLNNNGYY